MSLQPLTSRHGEGYDSGLSLLSLDAGGPPGISQLKILVILMHRLNFDASSHNIRLPNDIFDMIGGVGSGGFIAILLVFIGMTAEQALEEFIELSVNVLQPERMDPQARTTRLEEYIEDLLRRHRVEREMRLLDANPRSGGCKLVVPISHRHNIEPISTLRNFAVRQDQTPNITIAEAILATLATPPLFSSATIFRETATLHYISGELTISNPAREVISEAFATFGPEQRVACLLSLGCGHSGVLVAPEDSDSANWSLFLERLFRDNQRGAQIIESQMGHLRLYHRFSVTRGLERRTSTNTTEPGDIITHTATYLATVSISQKVDQCVEALKARDGMASLGQLKHSGGQTVLPSPEPLLTRAFVMRKKEWEFVERAILGVEGDDVDGPRMLAVTGIPGCGKTQLVLKFIRTHKRKFETRIYVDGSSATRIRADIIRHVRSLGIEHSQKTFDECLLFLSQSSTERPRLILYDNVDDPDLDLAPLLPRGEGCSIIMTSQNRSIGGICPDAHLELDEMSINEAVELLLHESNSSTVYTEQAVEEARAIAEALGCLPIALTQARSYMFHTRCSRTAYLERILRSRDALLIQPVKHQPEMRHQSTYAAFEASFDRLALCNQQFLRLFSYFHWGKVPLDLVLLAAEHHFSDYESKYVEHGTDFYVGKAVLEGIFHREGNWNVTALDEMMVSLQNYSLVTLIPGVDTLLLQIHPLAHSWIHGSIPELARPKYKSAAVLLLALGARKNRTSSSQYLASHVVHMTPIWDELDVNAAEAFGHVLDDGGLYSGSLLLRERVVNELRRQVHPHSACLFESLRSLAATYYNLGKFSEAQSLQEEVLRLKKERRGQRHVDTIGASNDLAIANTYRNLGRLKEAEELQKKVLRSRITALGEDHLDTVTASASLAVTYRYLGRPDEAERLLVRVLELRKQTLGDRHLDTLSAAKNLANTYRALKCFEEAERLQSEVLMLRREILGENHPETVRARNDLSLTYYHSGRLEQAENVQRDVLTVMQEVLGDRHPHTAKAMLNLADTCASLHKESEALELLKAAKPIVVTTFGKTHFQYERHRQIKFRVRGSSSSPPPTGTTFEVTSKLRTKQFPV